MAAEVSLSSDASICYHKGEPEESHCLLALLASRNGSTALVSSAIQNGAIVNEIHPNTEEGVLHVLLRRCVFPFELFATLKVLVTNGANVNLHDYRGATPLSLLILHVNHGLRYHGYHLPEVKRLEDLGAPKAEITKMVCGFDAEYQKQVYRCLEVLLSSGADLNTVPGVVPSLPSMNEWVEAFEHSLIQQEGRWHLLGFDTNMEDSTYNIFSPVSSRRCPNNTKLTCLHLAAWRGDARVINLLIQYGANAKSLAFDPDNCNSNLEKKLHNFRMKSHTVEKCASNIPNGKNQEGRSMLHMLYFYCNKPQDLPAATKLFLNAGTDASVLHEGQMAAHVLLRHVFVKRSYLQYLSNAYCLSEISVTPDKDNFISEIIHCFNALHDKSPAMNGPVCDRMLSLLYMTFGATLANADKEFQPKGYYLVPYTFRVAPLTTFSSYLVKLGAKVNSLDPDGESPLQKLINSMTNLRVDSTLNSADSLCMCFKVLLQEGADCNDKGTNGRTAVHLMTLRILKHISQREGPQAIDIFMPVIDLMIQYGGDLNIRDNWLNTPLLNIVDTFTTHWPVRISSMRLLYMFIEELLLSGADPSSYTGHIHYPLNTVITLHEHISHSSVMATTAPSSASATELDLDLPVAECIVDKLVRLLCGNMTQTDLHLAVHKHWSRVDRLFANYIDIFQSEASRCETCHVIFVGVVEPIRLKQTCRRTIWLAMDKGRFKSGVDRLPLPTPMRQYLKDFSQR